MADLGGGRQNGLILPAGRADNKPPSSAVRNGPGGTRTSDGIGEKTGQIDASADQPDAQSGADSPESPPSPSLSMLAKLVAGFTPDERAALARMLQQSEGG